MSEHDAPFIRLEGVGRIFTTEEVETHALAGIDLIIEHGEYLSVEGPSGCGKTTLLSILGLLDVPSTGRHLLAGRSVGELTPPERARVRNREVGFIFQAFNLIGELTVLENVELPLLYRDAPRRERREAARAALARVGMSGRERHYPAQLSGGQQQRVAVARAVVGRPSLLLADEPTGNLDSANSETVLDLIEELHAAGATVVMVTHDPRWAARARRTVQLFDGRLQEPAAEQRGVAS